MSEPKTVAEIDREITRLQEKRDKAARDEAIFKALPLAQRVAIVMHGNLCHSDHTEHCGWHYEVNKGQHDFNGSTHRHWLGRAEKTIRSVKLAAPELRNEDTIQAVIEAVTTRDNY